MYYPNDGYCRYQRRSQKYNSWKTDKERSRIGFSQCAVEAQEDKKCAYLHHTQREEDYGTSREEGEHLEVRRDLLNCLSRKDTLRIVGLQ
jgi:hypothetical protein